MNPVEPRFPKTNNGLERVDPLCVEQGDHYDIRRRELDVFGLELAFSDHGVDVSSPVVTLVGEEHDDETRGPGRGSTTAAVRRVIGLPGRVPVGNFRRLRLAESGARVWSARRSHGIESDDETLERVREGNGERLGLEKRVYENFNLEGNWKRLRCYRRGGQRLYKSREEEEQSREREWGFGGWKSLLVN